MKNDSDLRIIVLDNCAEFGEKVNKNLQNIRKSDENYMIDVLLSRFSNGEGKAKLEKSVRDKDVYIISDVGNYSKVYNMHGFVHNMSPDEHFQDIKRVISSTCGHAKRIHVVMPLLYQARQHKRNKRESLDCAIALQELEKMGVSSIITYDAHDPNVSNAVPNLPFESFYPTYNILDTLITKEKNLSKNFLVVSPDMGAMDRARYYADMLKTDVGVFYKRRDLRKVVNGKNPIVEHVYMGADVKGRDVLVVDDMIASGTSMIEVATELKNRGARKVFLAATFSLFTEGTDEFVKAHEDGKFDMLYSTNLSYVPDNIKSMNWYEEVDLSLHLAKVIDLLNSKESLEGMLDDGKEKLLNKIERVHKN